MAQDNNREQWARTSDASRTDFEKAKSPVPLRVGACAMCLLAALVQIGCMGVAFGPFELPVLSDLPVLTTILGVVICLALTVCAQGMWKKAGAVKSAPWHGPVGIALVCLGFVGWALFFLASKNLPSQSKIAGLIAALVAVAACACVTVLL